jgi:hypothetical protein
MDDEEAADLRDDAIARILAVDDAMPVDAVREEDRTSAACFGIDLVAIMVVRTNEW